MFDVWIGGDVPLTALLVLALVAVLPVQLVLCWKTRRFLVRMAPVLLSAAAGAACALAAARSPAPDNVFWLICALYAAAALLVCLVAWALWSVSGMLRRWDDDSGDPP